MIPSDFHESSFYGYLSLERRFSPHTLTAYRSDLSNFINYCVETQCLTSLGEVRHFHIRSWIVAQMQAGQSAIYYILGPSRRTVEGSPHLESLKARGYEVLYMTDPVDEWSVRALGSFGDGQRGGEPLPQI